MSPPLFKLRSLVAACLLSSILLYTVLLLPSFLPGSLDEYGYITIQETEIEIPIDPMDFIQPTDHVDYTEEPVDKVMKYFGMYSPSFFLYLFSSLT